MKFLLPISKGFIRLSVRTVCVILFGSCLAPIEFDTENIGGTLTVSGQISSMQDRNVIQLGLTADTERLPYPLSGASIVLFDDAGGSYFYIEDPSSPGTYTLYDVAGIPGKTYHIRITTPDGGEYESVAEKMPEVVGQLVTNYEIVEEEITDLEGIVSMEHFIKVYTNSSLPVTAKPSYLKWETEEAFLLSPTDFPDPFGNIPPPCFIRQNADPQRIALFNGAELNTTSINNLLVASRIVDWTFFEKHYFTTYQTSLTQEGYEYWRKVNILANQVGSIFDSPPAEITGNMYNVNDRSEKVLGYFQAVNQTLNRIVMYPNDFSFPLLLPNCTYSENRAEYPGRCLDCTIVRNSSYNRPDWF